MRWVTKPAEVFLLSKHSENKRARRAVNPAMRRDQPHDPNDPPPPQSKAEEPPVQPFQSGPAPDPLDQGGIDESTTSG